VQQVADAVRLPERAQIGVGSAGRLHQGLDLLLRRQAEDAPAAGARRRRRQPRHHAAAIGEAVRSDPRQRRHHAPGDAALRA
nr:hypothetical protein [Tanacetum cinerariifolium]